MEKIWNLIEVIMHFCIYRILRIKLSDEKWKQFCQFIKFGLVGLSNTLISYIVYVILIFLSVHYLYASICGFIVSVLNSFYWNNKYVFGEQSEHRVWWKSLVKTFMSYAGTGLILSNVLLYIWIQLFGISEIIAPILNLLITIPLNYLLNKFWAFR